MNTFDEITGVFRIEDPKREFTIAMVDERPGMEMFQVNGSLEEDSMPYFKGLCNEDELLHWLGSFFGTNEEGRFRHIIERIKMDRRQAEGADGIEPGSFA
jgi:hypothetical protein